MTVLRTIVLAALVSAAAGAAAAQGQAGPAGPASEVRALERALADAMHARDRARIDQLLAPAYVLRSAPDIDRDTWIRNAVTLCWGARSDIDGFSATPRGDVVIASFELTFYVDPATCAPAVLRSLVTDVWARDAGGWRLQLRHAAPPPKAGGDVASQYGAVPLPPPAWEVASEFSLAATAGNTSTRTIGAAGDLTHRAGRGTTRASAAFLTSEAEDVTRARSLTLQARHGVRVGARTELFGRGAYARDRFAGIENRAEVGAGAAYEVVIRKRHSLTAEGSVGFTREQRLDATDLRFAAATGGASYAWTIAPGTSLEEDVALSADLDTLANWRGTSTIGLGVALTQVLSLKVSHVFEYRNTPVPGFRRMDMRTAAALVLSWQRRPRLR